MICLKCGNSLDLFVEKCLKCNKILKGRALDKMQKFESKTKIRVLKRNRGSKRSTTKACTTHIRLAFDNGIAVSEGMSITSTKRKWWTNRPFSV